MGVDKELLTDETADKVSIKLAKDPDVRIVERYSFASSIFQQPSAFSVTLSGGHGAAEVMKRYPPGPSQGVASLYIGKYRQFTGEIDAVNSSGDASRTNVEIAGRDLLARLHDQDITGERSFDNATYLELFDAALNDVGLGHKIVEISNTANRNVRVVGTKSSKKGPKVKAEPVVVQEVKASPSSGGQRVVVTAKMGESWLQFLERQFAKVGLFAWADAYGNFVLSRPNAEQEPIFHFFRKRGQLASIANVKSYRFTNDTKLRFSEVVVFARNLGRKYGHNHTHGDFIDKEMQALGFDRRRVYRDSQVTSEEEGKFYARRKIAEANRASWKLEYTISGHSAPLIDDIDNRGIIVPDVIARVDDDELNIHENLYIESVVYRAPPRETVVTMMRPQDLVFGEAQATAGQKKAEKRVRQMLSLTRNRDIIDFKRTSPNMNTNAHRAAIDTVARKPRPKT